METRADVLPPSLSLPASHGWCHLHHRERGSPMKNRKREICTSGSVRDEAGQPPHLLGRNLAQRLERDWPGVAGSILEGIDEILTVTRLGLPKELRRSLACTNIIENVMSTGAARLPQREAMALGLDGDALDRSRYAGGGQRLSTTEGS